MARRATRTAERPTAAKAVLRVAALPEASRPLGKLKAPATAPATRAKGAKGSKKTATVTSIDKASLEGLSVEQKVSTLLREREALIARLRAAEARVALLEDRETRLTDRIAWALDTLNDLLRLPEA